LAGLWPLVGDPLPIFGPSFSSQTCPSWCRVSNVSNCSSGFISTRAPSPAKRLLTLRCRCAQPLRALGRLWRSVWWRRRMEIGNAKRVCGIFGTRWQTATWEANHHGQFPSSALFSRFATSMLHGQPATLYNPGVGAAAIYVRF
jgi:hypothetical protein